MVWQENKVISGREPDWSRERPRQFYDPARKLIKAIRDYQRHAAGPMPWHRLAQKWAVFRYRVWSIVTGAEIPLNTKIGGGLMMPHPNGVVVHPAAQIGPNVILFQQVTLGTNNDGKAPKLGGHVDVLAGAKLIGGITIGDHAVVAANSVVLKDVPPGVIVGGIPARQIGKRPIPEAELPIREAEKTDTGNPPA